MAGGDGAPNSSRPPAAAMTPGLPRTGCITSADTELTRPRNGAFVRELGRKEAWWKRMLAVDRVHDQASR